MAYLWLFVLGTAAGSFLNVLALRYDPDKFLLSVEVVGGRSRCPRCGRTLLWFELIPVLSFVFERGRCLGCGERINIRYPIVEIIGGLVFVLVPLSLFSPAASPADYYIKSAVWIFIFSTLLLVSLIDLRLSIIPDEANIFLAVLGAILVFVSRSEFGLTEGSFLGSYSLIFGWRGDIWTNRVVAILAAGALFGFIILITRGKGMGMGDLKLSLPLGMILGWPDFLIMSSIGFILGSIVGAWSVIRGKKTGKSPLPFGPFLASATLVVFLFGKRLADLYFSLFIG
ncbi:MAG: prepilin peptidase [Patescibacteria group bacterium]